MSTWLIPSFKSWLSYRLREAFSVQPVRTSSSLSCHPSLFFLALLTPWHELFCLFSLECKSQENRNLIFFPCYVLDIIGTQYMFVTENKLPSCGRNEVPNPHLPLRHCEATAQKTPEFSHRPWKKRDAYSEQRGRSGWGAVPEWFKGPKHEATQVEDLHLGPLAHLVTESGGRTERTRPRGCQKHSPKAEGWHFGVDVDRGRGRRGGEMEAGVLLRRWHQ